MVADDDIAAAIPDENIRGTLTLGSNSTITLGTATDLATLSIGWSQNTNGYSYGASATGRLDTTEGCETQ